MKRLSDKKVQTSKLMMLTPFMDVLTVLLIYLIVTFSPEQAEIELSKTVELPKAENILKEVPSVRVEVGEERVLLNGVEIPDSNASLNPDLAFKNMREAIRAKKQKDDQRVLIIADKTVKFNILDRAFAHVAAEGFSDIYLLTEMNQEEQK